MWIEQRLDFPAGNNMNMGQRLAENDQRYGRAEKQASQSREERVAELRSAIADAQNELARLENEAAVEANPNVATTGDPAIGLVVDNTSVDGETPAGAPEGQEDYSDEKYWTVARLKEEIESRNPDRKASGLQELSVSGKRAELVERLMKDDRELAEADAEA